MKLLKPLWVTHGGQPFFSLDVHPDGSRFATGGQGKDSGVVIIWNMAPVRSKSDEASSCVPKQLCELTNHLSCVNCIRWSQDGTWLASGGDDAIVMIWQIKHQGVMSSGFGGTSHEHWGCVHMLRGHASDVLDVSWSPDRKYLASCSVDNSIVIWNAKDLPQKITVMAGHQGLVKGLTWDPVGKFMASQSDDRSIRIWRTSDWKEAKAITEPFRQCSGTTHVLRLSWSPDGKYVVSAHALNNEGPTAQIIERGGEWKIGMDFVGHRKAVEVVLFNPHLFVKSGSRENHGCVAMGSKDRSLSVWLTNLKRPLVVLHDLFDDSILDLSWSSDGYELLVCSTDGSIAYLSFSNKELGLRLSKQALDDLYMNTYGFRRAEIKSSEVLIENPEMLKLHRSSDDAVGNTPSYGAAEGFNQNTSIVCTSAKVPTVTKQVETRTKEGRRRITPITLTTEPSSISRTPLPFTSFSPKQNKSAVIQVTPEKDRSSSKKSSSGSEHSTPKSCAEFPEGATPPKPILFEPLSPQRVQDPTSSSAAAALVVAKSSSSPSTKGAGTAPSSTKGTQKRPLGDAPGGVALPKAKKPRRGVQLGASTAHAQLPKTGTPQKQAHLQSVLKQASVNILLPAPKLEPSISIVLLNIDSTSGENPVISVDNDEERSEFSLSYSKASQRVWKVSLFSPCLLATADRDFTCVACQDKSLSVFSTQTGRLLAGRLFLPATCYYLRAESHFLMAVLCSGVVTVWDTKKMKALVREQPFSHLLRSSKHGPDQCLLTKDGLPVLKIGSSCYIFNADMQAWMELGTAQEKSEIRRPEFAFSSPPKSSFTLESFQLQQETVSLRDDAVGAMLHQARAPGASQSSTLGYLESQISRCRSLRSPHEYRHWCRAYVKFLTKNALEDRLREFCGEFSEPAGCPGAGGMVLGSGKMSEPAGSRLGAGGMVLGSEKMSEPAAGSPGAEGMILGSGKMLEPAAGSRLVAGGMVLGFGKMELLKEFLALIAANPKLQRLYSELKQTVESV